MFALDTTILHPGDPVPHFTQRTPSNPQYNFSTAAGRYIVLCFLDSAAHEHSKTRINAVLSKPKIFNDDHAAIFAISHDPSDESQGRLANRTPGFRVFWDFDYKIAKLYSGLDSQTQSTAGSVQQQPFWLVIDPTLRVIANIPFRLDGTDLAELISLVEGLPPPARFANVDLHAPILFLPRVFEADLCQHLIELYRQHGGDESGFMREVNGQTMPMHDSNHKRRKDYTIEDPVLMVALQTRINRRVIPEIKKVHQFIITRLERYIVACYAAEDGGHFAAHRDDTTKGTAHRRFAVSVNLNDDFERGEVSFPEYGPRGFKAAAGGAVVFSCSLLHKVSKVTQGQRYAFLPFLYDDAAARLRAQNAALVGETGSSYKLG